MIKKTADQKNKQKRFRHSLNLKTFLIMIALVLGMGGTVLVAGFFLYLVGMVNQFYVTTWNQANSEAAVLEQQNYYDKSMEVIDIYNSIPEEERGDGTSEEYHAHFTPVIDDTFRTLQKAQRDLKDRNGPMNSFIVAIDSANCKMIYICDSDPNEETFCYPGTWEEYPQEQIDALIHGRKISYFDKVIDATQKVQSVITNQPKFGLRCTGGSTLFETDQYTVMVCVDEKLSPMAMASQIFLTHYVLLLLFVSVITALIGTFIVGRKIVRPINKMAKAARTYSENKYTGNERYFKDLKIHTKDEIENLAVTLEDMESDLAEYVDNMKRITAQEERINTELSLAAKIQESMLPREFPAFPERNEFDVYAEMKAAREVGGDFYDFFLVDDDHLALVVGDVSGKGMPAALFMTASKIMLKMKAQEGVSPAEVLEDINERICANNIEEVFVTVWVGVLEISTGRVIAANAGHEYPVIMHHNGNAELIHDKHGFVIGGLTGMKYNNYELQIEPGDALFIYSDGVPEAMNEADELFNTDRMLQALNDAKKDNPRRIIEQVENALDNYVGGAEQFDDITMLCLTYRGVVNAQET